MNTSIDGDSLVKLNSGRDFAQTFGGTWTYSGLRGSRSKCFRTVGDACGMRTIFNIIGFNETAIRTITPQQVSAAISAWEQTPLNSIVPQLGTRKTFEVSDVLGGIVKDKDGLVVSAEIIRWDLLSSQTNVMAIPLYGDQPVYADPVLSAWEAEAACTLGIVKTHPERKSHACIRPQGLTYVGRLRRSHDDEFGADISSDVSKVVVAYALIAVYLAANLGKQDIVHSMYTMAAVCLVGVGASYTSSSGIGGFLGTKTNALNQNIPFLLLGLGVDDAFVLVAEYLRHTSESPARSIEERISLTAKTAGMSVLITSVTDALAFLIGTSTKLPGLSDFCLYAGLGVLACFLCQFMLFLPVLALNARRTDAGRLDVLCCITSSKIHDLEEPDGCCPCIPACKSIEPQDGVLRRYLKSFGAMTVKTPCGRLMTFLFFACLFVLGTVGVKGLHKDFDILWFFTEGSYVLEYESLSERYFGDGIAFDIYIHDVDVFRNRVEMQQLSSYLRSQDFILPESIQDWWGSYAHGRQLDANSTIFWTHLREWLQDEGPTGGAGFATNTQWNDLNCQKGHQNERCNPSQGIAHSRMRARLIHLKNSERRYHVLNKMRQDMQQIFKDSSGERVFPFSFEFLFWEEFSVIDAELVKNLIIAAGVIFTIISFLLPQPRVAIPVALTICVSVYEVIGFMSIWGITLNGIATIYILICVGLAVDVSAHIAHAFCHSRGTPEDRSLAALSSIGPSVLHAVLSTALAISVLAFTKTYVVRVCFKVLLLVTLIAGAHGIWLLPVVLAMTGGSILPEGMTAESASRHLRGKGSAEAVSPQKSMQPVLLGAISASPKEKPKLDSTTSW